MQEQLQKVVDLVNKLKDIGANSVIELPRIVVIGSQSSGKSSLLEAIVGMEFLPRGEGIVTRRPLELRLTQDTDKRAMCGRFLGSDELLYDFQQIHDRIAKLTEEVAGKKGGIVDDPIILTIYGPKCANLTLIDLPGITRVPLKDSDQHDDIEQVTREMVHRYSRCDRTILLAVIPANQDITTSDALLISKQVDPLGKRTIGVITKIDIMNHGCDAVNMILGQEISLRLGYIGVKLRSKRDMMANVSIEESIKSERQFFQNHNGYRHMSKNLLGIEALRERLVSILYNHIDACMPHIKKEVQELYLKLVDELQLLGSNFPTTYATQCEYMLKLMMMLCDRLKRRIRGNGGTGATIRRRFNELLQDELGRDITYEHQDRDLIQIIEDYEGDSLAGFPSAECFYHLIEPKLQRLHGPVIDCLYECSKIMEECMVEEIRCLVEHHPRMLNYLIDKMTELLNEQTKQVANVLKVVMEAEVMYLFTNSSAYLRDHGKILLAQTVTNSADENSKPIHMDEHHDDEVDDHQECLLIQMRRRMNSYYNAVVESIRETIPKVIGNNILRRFIEIAGANSFSMMLNMSRDNVEELTNLLVESDAVYNERLQIVEKLETIKEVHRLLDLNESEEVPPKLASSSKMLHCELVESDNKVTNTQPELRCLETHRYVKSSKILGYLHRISKWIRPKDVY